MNGEDVLECLVDWRKKLLTCLDNCSFPSQINNMCLELQARDDEIRHLKDRLFDLESSVHPDSNDGEVVCNYLLLNEANDD
jgi:hypothetical protein